MKKVTYYMHSCDTCCMIREMMKMNGRDCAKFQKSRKGTHWELLKRLMRIRQNLNSCLLKTKRAKRARAGTKTTVSLGFEFQREIERAPSF